MSDAPPPDPQPLTSADTKALIRTIVGTGIGLATLLLMLIGLMFQQNAGVNARFDDLNNRIDDVNANVNSRIDDLRGEMNRRLDEMNRRLDEMQADIRELRALIFEAFKPDEPAD